MAFYLSDGNGRLIVGRNCFLSKIKLLAKKSTNCISADLEIALRHRHQKPRVPKSTISALPSATLSKPPSSPQSSPFSSLRSSCALRSATHSTCHCSRVERVRIDSMNVAIALPKNCFCWRRAGDDGEGGGSGGGGGDGGDGAAVVSQCWWRQRRLRYMTHLT